MKPSRNRAGRPRNPDGPKVQLMAYVSADVAVAAKARAATDGFGSVSSWVSWVVREALKSESRDVMIAARLLGTTPMKAKEQLKSIKRVARKAVKGRGPRNESRSPGRAPNGES